VKTLEINQHLLNAYLEGVVAKHLEVCASLLRPDELAWNGD
jgi:hypothetical protein